MADEAWVLTDGTVVSMANGKISISADKSASLTLSLALGEDLLDPDPVYVGVGEHRKPLNTRDPASVYDWLCQRCYEHKERIASGPVPGAPRPPLPPGQVY
jgi:hypothetical protein